MHHYSIESDERERVFIFLALLSVVSSLVISRILLTFKIEIPWWIDAPSVMSIYAILILSFENYLWKKLYIRRLFGVITPIVNGNWKGRIQTEYDGYESSYDAKLEISQTWRRICFNLKTQSSNSKSITANISKSGEEYIIFFSYMNYPKPGERETLLPHKGFATLAFSLKDYQLEGEYFTDRFRKNNGKLFFIKD